jgi:arylsulfatase A-like enzyme
LVALIEHMDDGIGRVLGTLDKLGLADNTLVIFTSDNGGLLTMGANNGPWRNGKTTMYEGGLRVLCAARWPGHIKPGSQTDREALSMDIFATACQAAGAIAPAGIDGTGILPTLLGGEQEAPAQGGQYFVRREGGPMYGGKTIEAYIRGDWKILQNSPFEAQELYHLKVDPQETTNLANKEKQVLREMAAELRKHVQRGGQVPWQGR